MVSHGGQSCVKLVLWTNFLLVPGTNPIGWLFQWRIRILQNWTANWGGPWSGRAYVQLWFDIIKFWSYLDGTSAFITRHKYCFRVSSAAMV